MFMFLPSFSYLSNSLIHRGIGIFKFNFKPEVSIIFFLLCIQFLNNHFPIER